MKILYVGWGFSPFRMGGSLRYAESVMEGMAARGNTVGYFCPGRFSLLPKRASTLKTWSRGAVTMFEVRDSPIVPGWGLGTKNPRIEVECTPLRKHLETVLSEFRPEIVHIQDLQSMSADLVGAVKARGIPILYTLHDYGPLCPTFFLFRHDRVVCEDYRDGEECVKCSAQAPRDTVAFRAALGAHSLFGHVGGNVVSVASSFAKAFFRKAAAGDAAADRGDAPGFVARRGAFVQALSRADLLLPVSRRAADLYAAYGVSGSKVHVLHPMLPHHDRIRRVERVPRVDGKIRFGYLG
ncbi:MAG: glycosyltransferase, partial [Candidatus Deferrimicrobiaceae bacterium]